MDGWVEAKAGLRIAYSNQKINKRNNLLKKVKLNPSSSQSARSKLKDLNKEIKCYFFNQKSKSIRRNIVPSNSKSLWDAVRIAKDMNISNLPDIFTLNEIEIAKTKAPEAFAQFFHDKVEKIVRETLIDDGIHNGFKKVNSENKFFMTSADLSSLFELYSVLRHQDRRRNLCPCSVCGSGRQ